MSDSQKGPDNHNSRLAIGSADKTLTWYKPTLSTLTPSQRDVFENYSHIPTEDVIPHILKVRDRAWQFNPLPCIGMFRFLDTHLSTSPSYSHILSVLKSGGKLLDLGCCFGQELRALVRDGVPASSLYGGEIRTEFVNMGYDLFLDRDTLKSRFIIGDIFDDPGPWAELEGKLNVVHIKQFLHMFNWEEQKQICERIVRLLKDEERVLILGHQMGRTIPEEVPWGTEKLVYRHNVESFKQLWDEVGKITGSKWKVRRAVMDDALGERPWDDELTKRLVFEVERVC